jgi:nicotinamidase-related amidase
MRSNFKLSKKDCALLVIDMQHFFFDKKSDAQVPRSEELVNKIKKLVDVFAENGRPVIYTRHIDSNKKDNLMLRWWQDQLYEDDPMSEIVRDLDTSRGEVVIKHQYDAFLNTDLETILRKKGVKQVVICGVMTNICCETTARSAFMRGFEVYFVSDGTSTHRKEMHEATLLNLSYAFAVLVKADDVLKAFTR